MADIFPTKLNVAWEPLLEDEAPTVEEVIELAVRLEDRLRNGEKVKTKRKQQWFKKGPSDDKSFNRGKNVRRENTRVRSIRAVETIRFVGLSEL